MAGAVIQFVISAIVIIIAGAALTRFADAIAELTRLGRLLVGSILLAGATSLPELSVDLHAIRMGMPDLAVGDLVGSSLFNLLILAVVDLVHRSRGQMFSRMAAAHALSGIASIVLTALAAIFIFISPRFPELTLGRIGLGSVMIAAVYALTVRMIYCDQRLSAELARSTTTEAASSHSTMTLSRALFGFGVAATVIVLAGPYMAEAAGKLAELTGLGNTFMGSTLVALCTSLPELVSTITAVRMGAIDLAIGNIYGSNAFNMVLLLPLDVAAPGSLLAAVSPTHAVTCICTILVTSVILMGQLYQVERRIRFIEPDAALVIALIFASLGLIYFLR